MSDAPSQDTIPTPVRPQEITGQLKRVVWPVNGFAPGDYLNSCWVCGVTFVGDKRARKCLACAINRLVDATLPRKAR